MTAIAVTIAGSDSGGGAGIQADLKTFSALGVYGASVVTALTAQNTKGVTAIHDVPAQFVAAQMDAVFSDLAVGAGGERNVDAIVDQQRDVERRQRGLDGPRAIDHAPRVGVLVAQLHQRRAALRDEPREHREIAAVGALGIDQCIEAKVNAHHPKLFSLVIPAEPR